ncbi:terminase small subunit [Dyella halodurans]|uniref:Terminase small subunit n=1 Tax=Dyella halodurans TaxID=1920171 RepID=A0ABV9C0I8_9GAMM|nr:terminase small subunit [Dyella halodurans]
MGLTVKQEKFCQAYIETGNASEAYRQVYSAKGNAATVARSAHEVLENPKVAARVAELKEDQKDRHNVTVDSLLGELEEARKVGKEKGQAAAMVTATMSKAKLLGMEGSSPDDETPTSVKVTVQVQDARREPKRDPATA